jgi:hypothetical protein
LIGDGHCFAAHDTVGQFARGQRQLRVAQFVIDQPEAFTRSEPGVALPSLPGPNIVRSNVRIEKKHRRIDMGQIAALLR